MPHPSQITDRKWSLEVARTMGHLHENGNFTGVSLPLKTEAQRELAAYIVAALVAYVPPAETVAA